MQLKGLNTYARARNEHLSEVAERIGRRVLDSDIGANLVHVPVNVVTLATAKSLPSQ